MRGILDVIFYILGIWVFIFGLAASIIMIRFLVRDAKRKELAQMWEFLQNRAEVIAAAACEWGHDKDSIFEFIRDALIQEAKFCGYDIDAQLLGNQEMLSHTIAAALFNVSGFEKEDESETIENYDI